MRSRRARGFTLIEVMVSVSILAMIAAITWSSFNQTYKSKLLVERNSSRYHTARLALERISRELTMAYISWNEDRAQAEPRTFFVGKPKGDIDELRFSMFGHMRRRRDEKEADTSQVAYFGEPDPDLGSSHMNIVRLETRRLNYMKMEQAPHRKDVLCEDVVRLHFEYWDWFNNKWRDDWSTNAADGQKDKLPSKVKITLVVRDERGNEVPLVTQVRLPMQEPLNLDPINVNANSPPL